MRHYDADEAADLNGEQWQFDLLALNPGYVSWGPHEDYMWVRGEGWNSPIVVATWADFGPWALDDLNECVNFYFSVRRESKECPDCGGEGYAPEARKIANAFYRHSCEPGQTPWNNAITQDEVQALADARRLHHFTKNDPAYVPTAAEVNAVQGDGFRSHDAINRHILIRTRCARLGLTLQCPTCTGGGYVYTAEKANASLTLWWLHPRKGCSRGIEVTNLDQSDLPAVFAFLRDAASRNAARFASIPGGDA